MPQDQNQNRNNPKETNTPEEDNLNGAARVPKDDDADQQPPKVVTGALQDAVMRTFRGDISTRLGKKATPNVVNKFVPQAAPPQAKDAAGNPLPPRKKKNDAVVHTFKDDVQHLVRNRKMPMTRIAALESDRGREDRSSETPREPLKTTTVIAITAVLLVIASILGFGAFYAYQLNTAPNLTPQFEPAMLFTEAREQINITDKNPRGIMSQLATARKNTLFSLGSIIELYVLEESIPDANNVSVLEHVDAIDFLERIEANVPDTFIQTLGTDYMLGIHVIDETVPFMVLRTRSYGHAFSGMLQWERNIEENLMPFFSPNADFVKPAVAEGENTFTDTVIQNLDVRILRDSDGNIRLLYTFVDRSTVVITTNIRTLIELSSRLRVAEI